MRFRFGRGLTLLRGGNSGTSKIGEDVLYITAWRRRCGKWNSVECFGGFAFGSVYVPPEIPLRSLRMWWYRFRNDSTPGTGQPGKATLNQPVPLRSIPPEPGRKKKTCGL